MITPLENYILVEPIKDDVVEGGIYVPQSVDEKPIKGKVLKVGSECPVSVGEVVIFKKWADQSIKEKGKEYLLVKIEDLIAKIE